MRGRQCVGNAFEHGAYAARVLADAAQRLDDGAAFVEDDIAVLADEFKGERARDKAAAARDDVDVEMQDAVAPLLTYGGDAARFELLAQQHDEGRRLSGVLGRGLNEMGRRIARIRVDIEKKIFVRLADGENDGLLVRLIDLIDAPAREGICEFMREGGHGEAVKAHGIIFFRSFCRRKLYTCGTQ